MISLDVQPIREQKTEHASLPSHVPYPKVPTISMISMDVQPIRDQRTKHISELPPSEPHAAP